MSAPQHLNEWRDVYAAFKTGGACDAGAASAVFSDSITALLILHWPKTAQLLPLTASDPAFTAFILRHIDARLPHHRAMMIVMNAARHCPRRAGALCRQIAAKAYSIR